ncbi:hypothetical protein ACF073_37945 [Streptomyces sp. NPDC015171]|uniref:hypothetical protein n=1 Tax=Streptomyces sp. NPDC015171 TaxID=3364945 RepID=UPI003702FBF8
MFIGAQLGEELATGEGLLGFDLIAEAGVAGAGVALEHLNTLVTVLQGSRNGASGLAGDEPGQCPPELPRGQPRQPAPFPGDPVRTAAVVAVGGDPGNQEGDVLVGGVAVGHRECAAAAGAGCGGEQVGLLQGLEAFENGDGPGDGSGDDPRGLCAVDVFALEGEAKGCCRRSGFGRLK